MKAYNTPQVTDYGDVAAITAILGSVANGDILVDTNGNVEQTGNLSIDACPAQNPAPGEPCIVIP